MLIYGYVCSVCGQMLLTHQQDSCPICNKGLTLRGQLEIAYTDSIDLGEDDGVITDLLILQIMKQQNNSWPWAVVYFAKDGWRRGYFSTAQLALMAGIGWGWSGKKENLIKAESDEEATRSIGLYLWRKCNAKKSGN